MSFNGSTDETLYVITHTEISGTVLVDFSVFVINRFRIVFIFVINRLKKKKFFLQRF